MYRRYKEALHGLVRRRYARMTGKTIICIRHGESTFNAAWRATQIDPMLFDAPLSDVGLATVQAGRATHTTNPAEMVVGPPFNRALQTAVGFVGDHPATRRMRGEEQPGEGDESR